ncbi:hypothetical protein Pse7367_2711 [Thalassoporum mexicanum PCC 7367]|uniref:DUF937 domain-containing protein n=1 Tax=Thalassoporum mexicanum TaxID=3457544 RepID=UPI00029F9AF7|nr:DUF937 domain-containing protein [Pseudanabaena sp. PCC 7367]AFY70966.1 hypothetical protein Pse7367_2711 [Pseudanabaena sp. PCC 7367]
MGLFDQVVGALNNPEQQASQSQLGSILNTVQSLTGGAAGNDANQSTQQLLMSVVGKHVRSSLKQKRSAQGQQQVEEIVNRFASTNANPEAVQSVMSEREQQQTAQEVAQKTGLSMEIVQSMLPTLVPVVLNFLQTGAKKPEAASGATASNSVLNSFLDSDGDGDVDLGDAMAMASRFMQSK